MLYSGLNSRREERRRVLGPIRTGFRYGVIGAVVALVADLYFLVLDPASVLDWILAVIHQYHTQLALASFVLLSVLAALRVQPTRLDPDASYRSILARDGALCGVMVALVVGIVLIFSTAVQATIFADEMRGYSREAAPKIVSYVNSELEEIRESRIRRGESEEELESLPSPATVEDVRSSLQPPQLRDLGRSIANFVLRAVLLGTIGAITGLLRKPNLDPETTGKPREG